ncbi:TetR/AcrR family transcriptional regulator [Goodfellowiella coeruleoviolacea]|uniref:Transcriptional regulator, TetR family n=1 Tax=Goodfellowiella coeruleoviolacea TaxID=334858 RepID=A0AAE3GGP9_9PSEU|nr:TetR/AcrR family transcriptional regulator [Goodfellowiella coeruleoviolacea]MCP2166979.1 transcriptional regulator, TetR family [Goodfellowiella coeruleoviolacea]
MVRVRIGGDVSARERILTAAEELFAVAGFDATPTSRIAERAEVPKGLVHYYFRRKSDLLTALVARLPDDLVDLARVVVPGDIAQSLRRLVTQLDAALDSSRLLSHLLWREADTHAAVRAAMQARFERIVDQIRSVIVAASPESAEQADVDSAAELLALAVSHRHSMARHLEVGKTRVGLMERELRFIAGALAQGAGGRLSPAT